MTTSPITPSSAVPQPGRAERQPLRLSLVHASRTNPLHGAWWPQSRDLRVEAADLVDHFPTAAGRIERLLFSRPDWDAGAGSARPRRIQAAHGSVRLSSFPSDDTHVIVAKVSSGHRLRLLVVPSDTDPSVASRAMDRAAADDNTASPTALLGLEGPDQGGVAHDVWDDDTH